MDSIYVYSKGKVDELIKTRVDKDRVDTIEGYVERNTNDIAELKAEKDKLAVMQADIDELKSKPAMSVVGKVAYKHKLSGECGYMGAIDKYPYELEFDADFDGAIADISNLSSMLDSDEHIRNIRFRVFNGATATFVNATIMLQNGYIMLVGDSMYIVSSVNGDEITARN